MRAAWLLGFAAACDPGGSPQPPEAVSALVENQQPPEPTSQPASGDLYEATAPRILADGSELYGAALDDAQSLVSLADLLSEPRKYEGKVVKTEGKIARVCKAMGCWVEISDEAGDLRAPMAGHAYFLPQKVVGKLATIQGIVSLRKLTADQKEHLAAEGATDLEVGLSIDAAGVLVR